MNSVFKSVILLAFTILSLGASAQTKMYSGKIVDETTVQPIPYVTVVLVSNSSNSVLDGTTTNEKGLFRLKSDSSDAFIKISFFNYEEKVITDISKADLSEIKLKSVSTEIDGVEVTAEKSSMEFKLDKRVFNVGKDISTTGMGAMEVLNNVPSVSVDIEGNIKLR